MLRHDTWVTVGWLSVALVVLVVLIGTVKAAITPGRRTGPPVARAVPAPLGALHAVRTMDSDEENERVVTLGQHGWTR